MARSSVSTSPEVTATKAIAKMSGDEGDEDELLPYSCLAVLLGQRDVSLTIACYNVRINVRTSQEDLRGTEMRAAANRTQLAHYLANWRRPTTMKEFEAWLIRPCIPHFQQLIDHTNWKAARTLQEHYHAPVLMLKLENVHGVLEAKSQDQTRRVLDFKFSRKPIEDPIVSFAISQGVPVVLASQLRVIRQEGLSDWEYNNNPQLVETVGPDSKQYFFKAGFAKDPFQRELKCLTSMRKIGNDLSVTQLAGLVRFEGSGFIAGMLLEYIPQAQTIDWALDDDTPHEVRQRWFNEVRQTVEKLHQADIVWGDVKPENIMIDRNDHAIVIDFGGGYTFGWVDKDLQETIAGDLQGLRTLEQYLRLSNSTSSPSTIAEAVDLPQDRTADLYTPLLGSRAPKRRACFDVISWFSCAVESARSRCCRLFGEYWCEADDTVH